ncbi:MAG: DUF29 domain-containing protein [Deltaproteobacteria bacterium]|nr:DUF29 domain-containing protein [Deltaproteobacteria bacterium]
MGRIEKAHDFHAWLLNEANRLRLGDMIDRECLAEELEAMAGRERRELLSHFEVLLKHLLKWQFQPNRHGMSWRNSIKVTRRGIEDLLEDSPSLKPSLADVINKAYMRARSDNSDEIRLTRKQTAQLPETCPWTFDQLMNPDFWPGKKALKTKPNPDRQNIRA